MKINKKLILASGILLCSHMASAATLYFSGYVSSVTNTAMPSNLIQTGMLIQGTFDYDLSAPPSAYSGTYYDRSQYSTGKLNLTIGNDLWLSTNTPDASTYQYNRQLEVTNSKSSYFTDEFRFTTSGYGDFNSNFQPAFSGGRVEPDTALIFDLSDSTNTALSSAALPSPQILLGNLFNSKTLSITFNASVGVSCPGGDYTQMCTETHTYTVNSVITSVSPVAPVPLPPTFFLMSSSMSLLLIRQIKRKTAEQ